MFPGYRIKTINSTRSRISRSESKTDMSGMAEGPPAAPKPGAMRAAGSTRDSSNCSRLSFDPIPSRGGPTPSLPLVA